MVRRGMVEKLRDGVADLVQPCPIEIAKHDSLFRFLLCGFDQAHLPAKILPCLAVEDQSIDPCPKLRVHRVGKIVLPPEIQRQIGIEMGKDDARQKLYARTFQRKRNLFGTNLFTPGARHVAMRVDPGFDPVLF